MKDRRKFLVFVGKSAWTVLLVIVGLYVYDHGQPIADFAVEVVKWTGIGLASIVVVFLVLILASIVTIWIQDLKEDQSKVEVKFDKGAILHFWMSLVLIIVFFLGYFVIDPLILVGSIALLLLAIAEFFTPSKNMLKQWILVMMNVVAMIIANVGIGGSVILTFFAVSIVLVIDAFLGRSYALVGGEK